MEERIFKSGVAYLMSSGSYKDFIAIVEGRENALPKRKIEEFIMEHAKNKKLSYSIMKPDGTFGTFNIYEEYQRNVKKYRTKNFSLFRRGQRRYLQFPNENFIETTVGQINIFVWLFSNRTIDYIID